MRSGEILDGGYAASCSSARLLAGDTSILGNVTFKLFMVHFQFVFKTFSAFIHLHQISPHALRHAWSTLLLHDPQDQWSQLFMVHFQFVCEAFSAFIHLLQISPHAFRQAWSTLLLHEPQDQCGGWRPCGGGGGEENQKHQEHRGRGHHGGGGDLSAVV